MNCLNKSWCVLSLFWVSLLVVTLSCCSVVSAADEGKPLVGGPLAGIELPPHPDGDRGELELYPGGVEHFRAYFTKYLAVRSNFDRQSQLKFWTAPNIPMDPASKQTPKPEQYTPPTYQIGSNSIGGVIGNRKNPVTVIRSGIKAPIFKLDLGELTPTLYALRLIAAVETTKLRQFRQPVYVTVTINDGPKGELNTYRQRLGYVDDFYSIGEWYFHVDAKRQFQATMFVDDGSAVDLLVHAVSLDDVMAGSTWKAIKKQRTLNTSESVKKIIDETPDNAARVPAPRSSQERLVRDEAIWKYMGPLNSQMLWIHGPPPTKDCVWGSDTMTMAQIEEQYGKWEYVESKFEHNLGTLSSDPKMYNAFLVNKKLNLTYTIDDWYAHKPLPDPYPFKDTGAGLFFPDPSNPAAGKFLASIAAGVHTIIRPTPILRGAIASGLKFNNNELLHDAAMDLVRYAYMLPALDSANALNEVMSQPGFSNRESRCRMRICEGNWRSHYANYLDALSSYDLIFPYIKDNQELANSIHHFVSWVNTPEDVIKLLDVYLVQSTAKKILRYQVYTHPMGISTVAATLGDAAFTRPWMQWQFDRTFIYPLQPSGAQDVMISGTDRTGTQSLGSTYYSQEEGAMPFAAGLEDYLRSGGDREFDLSDPRYYPKPLAHCYWQFQNIVAGGDFTRIGDVSGPDKIQGFTINQQMKSKSLIGWQLSADPQFAWIIRHWAGRTNQTDQQWKDIETAAGKTARAPWLNLTSRYIAEWATVLETGLEHDDRRFRRAVYLRTGEGTGHEHTDTLDLQIVAHGLPMTIDDGQRSGYSKPNSKFSRVHNTAEIDVMKSEYGYSGHTQIRALTDAPGMRFMDVQAEPEGQLKLMRRQVALIDVDEGEGSRALSASEQIPSAVLPKNVKTANSYVVDFFRIGGGKYHLYNFHGMIHDDFQWNVSGEQPVENIPPSTTKQETEAQVLSIFDHPSSGKFAGNAPDELQATWRYSRDGKIGSEQTQLGSNFDEKSPRKYTRLHMLDAQDMRALRADLVSTQLSYRFTNLTVRRKAPENTANSNTLFTAVIEPYAGDPFITETKSIRFPGNRNDGLSPAGVIVKTKTGRTDTIFAQGSEAQGAAAPQVWTAGDMKVSAQFAAYLRDSQGLVGLTITGGSVVETPEAKLEIAQPVRVAKVIKVDYVDKILTIDQPWPARKNRSNVLIGLEGHRVNDDVLSVATQGQTSTLQMANTAEIYRSKIMRVVPAEGRVDAVINLSVNSSVGLNKNIVASNDARTKFWRADSLGGNDFAVKGANVSAEDFAPQNVLRLWDYGVGDEIVQPTSASLKRVSSGVFQLSSDVDVVLSLKATSLETSTDGKTWTTASGNKLGDKITLAISASAAINQPLWLRVK